MRKIEQTLRWLAGNVFHWAGLVVLNYHRIGDPDGSPFDHGLWSASPDAFDQQLRWLKARFDVIEPGDLSDLERVRRGRHVLITFDDGYQDNHSVAFQLLRSHGLKATFFVATGYLDHPRLPWWDEIAWMVRTSKRTGFELAGWLPEAVTFDEPVREQAIRRLLRTYKTLPVERTGPFVEAIAAATGTGRYTGTAGTDGLWMTWDMVREMRAGGMTIGGHTVSHQVLSRMSRDDQWNEIDGCGKRLQEELGVSMRTFSYPVGKRDSFNADTRECLRRATVQNAFTYYGGIPSLRAWDEYDVPRIAIEHDTSFDEFRATVMAPWRTR